ncbi:MAG: hypothetical protein NTV63_04970 [Candidatus Woesearchaeota archaeon]|nr:hypothetical protein [Candidatus Woesearchaeota archaeon]
MEAAKQKPNEQKEKRRGIFAKIRRFFSEFRDYNRIAKIDEIARRYFLMNTFDGVMTILGIIMGSMFSNSGNPRLIINVGIGAAVAMAVSGIWGAYTAEHTERIRELKNLEKATLRKLKNTKIARAFGTAEVIIAVIDGISPLTATFIILVPFFFTALSISTMYTLSIAIAFSVLAILGVFTAVISKERIMPSVFKMILAGTVSAIIGKLLIK